MTQPRTTASLTSNQPPIPRPHAQPKAERDWIGELTTTEQYIHDSAEFHQIIDTSKMIQVVTDGGARSIRRAAGWGAAIAQNKAFTMM
jgi:hypothetical protein